MDRLSVELSALAFQALITALLALVYWGLWIQRRRPHFLSWSGAWAAFALRLGFISAFVLTRREIWLFAHQAATGVTALLLLWAAIQFSRDARWRMRYLWLAAAAVAWAYAAIFLIRDMRIAGISAAVLLAAVTFWTGLVFWRRRGSDAPGATVLSWTFILWGVHHLDYPLLRAFGNGVLYGMFADVLFIVAATIGTLFLVLGHERRALETRSGQLEQLTRLLLRAQEEERRRISRELHDEAGQVLTALKIQLDLEGRTESSALVSRVLGHVRHLSDLLRPPALDQLGLEPALRSLLEDFGRRTGIDAALETDALPPKVPGELEVVVYRAVQEALTNVARHARAAAVKVWVTCRNGEMRLVVEDDGCGMAAVPVPHLGLLGMQERVTAVGGRLTLGTGVGGGVRLEAVLPLGSQP